MEGKLPLNRNQGPVDGVDEPYKGDATLYDDLSEIILYCLCYKILWVLLVVKNNESLNPLYISVFRRTAHVFSANLIANLVERARRGRRFQVSSYSVNYLSDNPFGDNLTQRCRSSRLNYAPNVFECKWTLLGYI